MWSRNTEWFSVSEGVGEFGGKYIYLQLSHGPMARRKTSKKLEKCVRDIWYALPSGTSYVDIFKDLSVINRKLFRQGHVLGIQSIEFGYSANPATTDTVWLTAATAGESWPVHNSWVKGKALWNQMNELVLEDNPSVQGKWADFKVSLDAAHAAAGTSLEPLTSAGVAYNPGEWTMSTFVLPQHEVDPATGLPLAADETKSHLLGDDVLGVPPFGHYQSIGLVKAYEESRATVNPDTPNVPAGMSSSFFNLLTDSGSQEPELADVIEYSNDNPPYDLDNYPGGDTQNPYPIQTEYAVASVGYPTGILSPFVAQCGLIKLTTQAYLDGVEVAAPLLFARVTVMAGNYKGVAAVPMGQ
uniref:Uncharacterized protein n=1 Tax=uncultured marine virus TaxID=186617 RepID=S4TE53_9VIRU|nr:hypothetical protein [uncultured marine virus]